MSPAVVPAAIVGATAVSYVVAMLADVILKWPLAPAWREMIRNAAGW